MPLLPKLLPFALRNASSSSHILRNSSAKLTASYHSTPPSSSFESRRHYASKSFFEKVFDLVKQEAKQDKQFQANIAKFQQETKKLESSEALQKAREKFDKIEKETNQGAEVLNETLGKIKSKVSETAEEIGKTDLGKGARKFKEGVSGAAKAAGSSEAMKKVQSGLHSIAEGTGAAPENIYRAPKTLRMRKIEVEEGEEKTFEADTDTTNVVMHKDSVWNQQWETFKTSPIGEKLSDMKIQYDESDNLLIRGTRFLTDKVTNVAGGMFGSTDLSKVMTEISKVEPNFSQMGFILSCRHDIIPNILEAVSQNNEKIVKDWCTEATYNQMLMPAIQAKKLNCKYVSRIIDIDDVDIQGGAKVDMGPVLVIRFQTQQLMYVVNSKGDVVEGDANKVMMVTHVWVLCRDLEELDPAAGWKLVEQQQHATPAGF